MPVPLLKMPLKIFILLCMFFLFLCSSTMNLVNSTHNGTNHNKMTVQSILANEIATINETIKSMNRTHLKEVLQDVANVMEQEVKPLEKAANKTVRGLGTRFWEIHQKIFNNTQLTDEEKPLVIKILHQAASNADAKLPEPLSKAVNETEVLLEEKRGYVDVESDILI